MVFIGRIAPEIQLHETDPQFPYRLITVDRSDGSNYWHTELEIIKIPENGGELNVKVSGDDYFLSAGDILLIPGGYIHKVETPGNRHIVVQFDLSLFLYKNLSYPLLPELTDKIEKAELCSKAWQPELKDEVSKIIERLSGIDIARFEQKAGYYITVQSLLYQLVETLYTGLPRSKTESRPDNIHYDKKMLCKLEKVLEYIKNNYGENITLETAARVANYSVNYFTKMWYRYMGVRFHTYLNDYRINEATVLLKDSSLNITEIASRCGFGSYKTFIRVFRGVTGMSAAEYRKRFGAFIAKG